MNLLEHARRELALAGVEEDIRPSLLGAIEAFTSYGHSGGSASVCIPLLNDLLNYRALTPLTDDPAEWEDESARSGYPLWQNVRDSQAFSRDGGRTYFMLSEERRWAVRVLSRLPWPVRRRMPDVLRFPLHRSVRR